MLESIRIYKDFDNYKDDVFLVYREAYSGSPYYTNDQSLTAFERTDWPERIKQKGFELVVVKDKGEPIGMAYGWKSVPGAYWTEKLRGQLGESYNHWTENNFELVDIAIIPKYQGKGAGKFLYQALFEDLKYKTAILYTLQSETVAYQMYLKLGWQILRDNFVFKSGKSFVLMGKELR
jgi:ribosomal protein S18 acetylase RimI-like enzyme